MPTVPFRSPLSFTLINQSTCVTDDEVATVCMALHTQLNRDFAPYWGIDGQVGADPSGHADGELPVFILDHSDQDGALGYHDDDDDIGPYGRVFVATIAEHGLRWTVTASHEVLEMAADAWCLYAAQYNPAVWVPIEPCDAVQADADAYEIDGVWVSDFVTPAWFGAGDEGPYDHLGLLTAPFTLRKGGYATVHKDGRWHHYTAQPVPGETSRAAFAHRRAAHMRRAAARFEGRQVVEDDGSAPDITPA